jgi:hypothetical protein
VHLDHLGFVLEDLLKPVSRPLHRWTPEQLAPVGVRRRVEAPVAQVDLVAVVDMVAP